MTASNKPKRDRVNVLAIVVLIIIPFIPVVPLLITFGIHRQTFVLLAMGLMCAALVIWESLMDDE